MLRILKKVKQPVVDTKQSTSTRATTDVLHLWTVRYMDADTLDDIGTILCLHSVFSNLSRPKKRAFHTEAKLKLWYSKLLKKKYGMTVDLREVKPEGPTLYTMVGTLRDEEVRTKQVEEVMVFPLFHRSMKDYSETIEPHESLPEFLKIEMRSHLEELYEHNEANSGSWTDVCG